MKLILLFRVMDLFTVLAYPFVFIDGKIRRFSKSKAGIDLVKLLAADSTTPSI